MQYVLLIRDGETITAAFAYENETIATWVYNTLRDAGIGPDLSLRWIDHHITTQDDKQAAYDETLKELFRVQAEDAQTRWMVSEMQCPHCGRDWVEVRPEGQAVTKCPDCGENPGIYRINT